MQKTSVGFLKIKKTVRDSNSVIITGLRGSFRGANFSERDWKTSMTQVVQAVSWTSKPYFAALANADSVAKW